MRLLFLLALASAQSNMERMAQMVSTGSPYDYGFDGKDPFDVDLGPEPSNPGNKHANPKERRDTADEDGLPYEHGGRNPFEDFILLDINGDGILDADELSLDRLFRTVPPDYLMDFINGLDGLAETMEDIVAFFDTDGDGVVHGEEFTSQFQKPSSHHNHADEH